MSEESLLLKWKPSPPDLSCESPYTLPTTPSSLPTLVLYNVTFVLRTTYADSLGGASAVLWLDLRRLAWPEFAPKIFRTLFRPSTSYFCTSQLRSQHRTLPFTFLLLILQPVRGCSRPGGTSEIATRDLNRNCWWRGSASAMPQSCTPNATAAQILTFWVDQWLGVPGHQTSICSLHSVPFSTSHLPMQEI